MRNKVSIWPSVVIIVIFTVIISYEFTTGRTLDFILNLVTAGVIMACVAWLEVKYIMKTA